MLERFKALHMLRLERCVRVSISFNLINLENDCKMVASGGASEHLMKNTIQRAPEDVPPSQLSVKIKKPNEIK